MNKLGMHVHGMKPGIMEAIELLHPRTITIMDPTPQEIQDIRSASPGTFIVARKYEDGRAWRETDPFLWAEQNYDLCGGLADGVVAWNEPFGHDDRGSCVPFDEWTYVFISACRQLGTMEAVTLCMATGNWTGADDRYKVIDDFPLTCRNARYFGPHEYCWPTMQVGVPWYTLRYRAWIEDLEATGRDDFYFVISEAGLTQAIIPGRPDRGGGWRSGGPEGVTEDSYIATIDWYNARLCEDWRVLGCCLYDYAGQWYNWPTFEQLGLEGRIYQIQAPEAPEPPLEPPEPPNGGNRVIPDRVKIYDFDHGPGDPETASIEWLESIFGPCIIVHPVTEKYQPQQGEVVYQLEWINCKPATASCIIEVKDILGNPAVGETIIFGWETADPHGLADFGWNWTDNGAVGLAEPPDAHVGPGMSVDSYYPPDQGECGAHFIWIHGHPSEMVDGVGMLPFHDLVPGATHLHTEYGFRAVRWEGEEPEPPTPPGDPGEAMQILSDMESKIARLRAIMAEWDAKAEELAGLI